MKQLQTSLLLTAALSLAAASAYTQAAKSSPGAGASASPPTISSAIDREISIIEKEIVQVAEAMPEDKFHFSPEKLNISGSDYKVCAPSVGN